MREIKFRAWNKVWGMMSLVDKIEFEEGKPVSVSVTIEATDFDHTDEWSDYEVGDDIIFQQFTGLKDKNGKEIYEGDIVETNQIDGRLRWLFEYVKEDCGVYGGFNPEPINHSFSSIHNHIENCEVVGNIFENQELLTTNHNQSVS